MIARRIYFFHFKSLTMPIESWLKKNHSDLFSKINNVSSKTKKHASMHDFSFDVTVHLT
jgi:hypothetical protein